MFAYIPGQITLGSLRCRALSQPFRNVGFSQIKTAFLLMRSDIELFIGKVYKFTFEFPECISEDTNAIFFFKIFFLPGDFMPYQPVLDCSISNVFMEHPVRFKFPI